MITLGFAWGVAVGIAIWPTLQLIWMLESSRRRRSKDIPMHTERRQMMQRDGHR